MISTFHDTLADNVTISANNVTIPGSVIEIIPDNMTIQADNVKIPGSMIVKSHTM